MYVYPLSSIHYTSSVSSFYLCLTINNTYHNAKSAVSTCIKQTTIITTNWPMALRFIFVWYSCFKGRSEFFCSAESVQFFAFTLLLLHHHEAVCIYSFCSCNYLNIDIVRRYYLKRWTKSWFHLSGVGSVY
jgi:hypothetical protein